MTIGILEGKIKIKSGLGLELMFNGGSLYLEVVLVCTSSMPRCPFRKSPIAAINIALSSLLTNSQP